MVGVTYVNKKQITQWRVPQRDKVPTGHKMRLPLLSKFHIIKVCQYVQ